MIPGGLAIGGPMAMAVVPLTERLVAPESGWLGEGQPEKSSDWVR